jgi:hypothetical protein
MIVRVGIFKQIFVLTGAGKFEFLKYHAPGEILYK